MGRRRSIEAKEVGVFLGVLLLLLLFAGGVGAIGSLVLPDLELAWASRSWPVTEGELLEKDLTRRRKTTVLRVRYRYHVDDVEHTGDTISFAGHGHGQASRDLRHGKPVRVHFDPARPSRSVLYPGIVTASSITVVGMYGISGASILAWLGLGIRRLAG